MTNRLAESDLNLATAWEAIAGEIPDRPAVICGDIMRTWAQFEDRAARLATVFDDHGVGRGAKVAVALYNGNEYLEAEFASFKVRAVPANVNYRYRADEMRYVLNNADAEVVLFDHSLRDLIDEIRSEVPTLGLAVEVNGDGVTPSWAIDYESAIASATAMAPIERSGGDQWFLYTGGTTGQPKAVMWEHRGLIGGMESTFRPFKVAVPTTAAEAAATARAIVDQGAEVRQIAASPLMHGTASMSSKGTLTHGGMVITLASRSFDPAELFRAVEAHRATMLTIVGDAFSRPMLEVIAEAEAAGTPYDLSSVRSIVSSGIMWSAEIKQQFIDRYPVTLVDILGSSEGTGMARQVASRKKRSRTATFTLSEHSQVFTDDGQPVLPGSGETGRIAIGFPVPLGYYKDPDKTEENFPLIAGRRWSVPGDYASVEADGTVVLLGRGSACINTGGEKVYPEEVEESLKTHVDVVDANVFAIPDERWGSAVCAVVSLIPGATATADDLRRHVREKLAPYKAPKQVVLVNDVERKANGKPDYEWAKAAFAAAGLA